MERGFQRMYLESRSRSHHGHGGDGSPSVPAAESVAAVERFPGPETAVAEPRRGAETGKYGCEYGGLVS
jgi:hypothetical protein